MTVTTHTYTAVIIGTPDVPLSVVGGHVTLDARTAPHVQATLTIAQPDAVTLAMLDPRQTVRVRVTAGMTGTGPALSRTFDLGLRKRPFPLREGRLQLELASDEAITSDYAPLADDITPRTHAASLRAVINYALGKAITGAALAAVPGIDADATRYWPVTNLAPNPRAALDATGWHAGDNATAAARQVMGSPLPPAGTTAITWDAAAAGTSNMICGTDLPWNVQAGRWYVFSFYVCADGAANVRASIQWWTAGGVLASTANSATVAIDASQFRRVTVIAQAPPGAMQAVTFVSAVSAPAFRSFFASCALFYEGDELVKYYDGGTAAGGGYTYAWQGDAHKSASTRTPVREVSKDSLTWRAGQSALDFLHPLVQAAGYRLVCDETRTWTLRDDTYQASGSLTARQRVNLVDADDTLDRGDRSWFDAAVTRYTWEDAEGIRQERIDAYALTTPYTQLRLFDKPDTPYPGPGFSQYAVARAQGRGREVTVTTVADWRARAEMFQTVTLDATPLLTGKTDTVVFDLDRDEMTTTARTIDTPDTAWITLLPGVAWTASPIGATWIGETV